MRQLANALSAIDATFGRWVQISHFGWLPMLLAVVVLATGISTPAHAFCMFGWGPSCLPDERVALRYAKGRLLAYQGPKFPVITSFDVRTWSVSKSDYAKGGTVVRAELSKAKKIVEQMAEGIRRGDSCTQIMAPDKIAYLWGTIAHGRYYRTHDPDRLGNAPFGDMSLQKLILSCEIMQVLSKKTLIEEISSEFQIHGRFNDRHTFSIVSNGTADLDSLTQELTPGVGRGIDVSRLGRVSVVKNYSQQAMGTTIGTVEFVAPVDENEFAAECRRLDLECGRARKFAVGAVDFLKRSDGWALQEHSFRFSVQ